MIDFAKLAQAGSEEERLARRLEPCRLPRHVAIIMDGNGRWARQRGLPRVAGHRAGIEAVRDTLEVSARLGLEVLTLYAFSVENWKRPVSEVGTLMKLLGEYVRRELQRLVDNGIRLRVIGRIEDLPDPIQRDLGEAIAATRSNGGLTFNIALSYGARAEIVEACRALLRRGADPRTLDEGAFAGELYTAGQPDPDLLIRTSGEMRVSNFLLWQIAYSEIWVTQTLWPDFRRLHLFAALLDYASRERRYGGLLPEETADPAAVAGRVTRG